MGQVLGAFEVEAGHLPVGDAAGNNPLEIAEVGRDVEGEAMRSDTLRDMNADRGDLLLRYRAACKSPNASATADPLRGHAKIATGADEYLFEKADEIDRAEVRAALAREIATQVDDWIADKLARAMVGYVSTTIDLVDLHASTGEVLVRSKNVGARGVTAQSEHRGMLQEEQRVADAPLFASFDDTPLDLKRLCVRNTAETEEVDQHG